MALIEITIRNLKPKFFSRIFPNAIYSRIFSNNFIFFLLSLSSLLFSFFFLSFLSLLHFFLFPFSQLHNLTTSWTSSNCLYFGHRSSSLLVTFTPTSCLLSLVASHNPTLLLFLRTNQLVEFLPPFLLVSGYHIGMQRPSHLASIHGCQRTL